MKKTLIILTALLAVAGTAVYFYTKRSPAPSYRTARVERGTIVSTVAATGSLSAVTTVQVGTQVSGTIQKLHVDYNSRVRKGEAIAEIDPSLFQAAVEQANGNFLNAEAGLQKARVTLADAERTVSRTRRLLADGIVSQGDFDAAETALHSARAGVKGAEGVVSQTKGSLMQARTNLNYSVIRSPVNGVIISRSVDVGQTVAASFQTPTLFTIAQDLTKMQIEVSVDEADISRIRLGQSASFTVDSYPEQPFSGRVAQIRSAPVISQNVVTYVVVVTVDNSDLKLKPGMTANVSVEVARKDNVLVLPPAALRFRPKSTGKEAVPSAAAEKRQAGGAPAGGPPGKGRPGGRKGGGGQQVYQLKEGRPVAIAVKTGIADNGGYELVEGALREGDEVIVEQTGGENGKKKSGGMGGPMGPRF